MNEREIKNLKAITAVSVTVAAATSFLATDLLVKTAIDRNAPESAAFAGKHIAGSKGNNDFMKKRAEAASKLESTPTLKAETTGHDGILLVGHWYPALSPKRVIIAMHGWRSSWSKDFGLVADFWHDNDCSVLFAEQRGQNASGGDYIGFGLTERYDCLTWINWVLSQCGDDVPIYLAGVSMGATTVLMADGLSLPPRVHGIMADCGFTSPNAIWKYIARHNLHISYGLRGAIADQLAYQKVQTDMDTSTTDALRIGHTPVLLVHGSADRFVPVNMTYENYLACHAPKRLLIVPGAGHGMSCYIEPEKYKTEVLNFWKDFDPVCATVIDK